MDAILNLLLKLSIVIFMAGNLFDMGLRLDLKEVKKGFQNLRFIIQTLFWGFVIIPVIALLILFIIPLEPPYAIGLILLSVSPCASFLPMMVDRAKGDLGLTATFMLLVSTLIVIYSPIAVPLLAEGLDVSAWAIARPLLIFVLVPLVIGISILKYAPIAAGRILPVLKKLISLFTILMLLLCIVIYGEGFINSAGSFFLAAQLLFFSLVTVLTYSFSFGINRDEKVVLSLGMTSRNLGAALAPLYSIAAIDERAIVMVVLAVPLQVMFSFIAANYFGKKQLTNESN